MGVVGREADEFVGLHLADQRRQLLARELLDGLRGEADLVADDLARQPSDPRRLVAQLLVLLVGVPHEMRHVGEAALDQDHLQFRIFVEHAVEDEADRL